MNSGQKFLQMKKRQSPGATRRELERLMAKKRCYAPFSFNAIVDLANPRKPSTRPLTPDLVTKLRKHSQELLNRALAGQPDALNEFCRFAHNLIRQLRNLSKKKQREISAIASAYEEWPILYSPDENDPGAIYKELRVGTESFVERYAGRKIDRENDWTKLALLALEMTRHCKARVSEITRNQPFRQILSPYFASVGKTKMRIYYYDTPSGLFEIPEWCVWCADLPDKLRSENVDQFWKPVRFAVLQYWDESERIGSSAYSKALKLTAVMLSTRSNVR
jgi:hypothetical protein